MREEPTYEQLREEVEALRLKAARYDDLVEALAVAEEKAARYDELRSQFRKLRLELAEVRLGRRQA